MTSTILENLPQIITSLAALITAVTGLIKVLRDKDKTASHRGGLCRPFAAAFR
ncbi:hypothetical protein TUM12131_51170 (plasmid) [Klebsiella pneumoniae]|nr:hypothetical protein TUM12131_51170 [Klebsiella pneumoniae]